MDFDHPRYVLAHLAHACHGAGRRPRVLGARRGDGRRLVQRRGGRGACGAERILVAGRSRCVVFGIPRAFAWRLCPNLHRGHDSRNRPRGNREPARHGMRVPSAAAAPCWSDRPRAARACDGRARCRGAFRWEEIGRRVSREGRQIPREGQCAARFGRGVGRSASRACRCVPVPCREFWLERLQGPRERDAARGGAAWPGGPLRVRPAAIERPRWFGRQGLYGV